MKNEIKSFFKSAALFVSGIVAGVLAVLLHNGGSASGTGRRGRTAEKLADEAAGTNSELEASNSRTESILAEIRTQKL